MQCIQQCVNATALSVCIQWQFPLCPREYLHINILNINVLSTFPA